MVGLGVTLRTANCFSPFFPVLRSWGLVSPVLPRSPVLGPGPPPFFPRSPPFSGPGSWSAPFLPPEKEEEVEEEEKEEEKSERTWDRASPFGGMANAQFL